MTWIFQKEKPVGLLKQSTVSSECATTQQPREIPRQNHHSNPPPPPSPLPPCYTAGSSLHGAHLQSASLEDVLCRLQELLVSGCEQLDICLAGSSIVWDYSKISAIGNIFKGGFLQDSIHNYFSKLTTVVITEPNPRRKRAKHSQTKLFKALLKLPSPLLSSLKSG